MSAYAGDVAALARKDLLLEVRSRDTLPAMLLFVVSALTIFHFALPAGSSERAETGLLWIAIVFTALLGLTRAFAAEREEGVLDGLVLAPCDRSAIWLGKALSILTFLVVVEGTAQIEADGDALEASVGTMVAFDPDERHVVASDSGAKILLMLTPWPGEGHYRGDSVL